VAQPRNSRIGRTPEKIHPDHKQDGVNDAGNQDPLPQPVLANKCMRFKKRLYGNDDFFEQALYLWR
jgi:hypothetical protein